MPNQPTPHQTRQQTLQTLNQTQTNPPTNPPQALIGLDGFVDHIIHPVDKRQTANTYQRIPTLTQLAQRIHQAAHKSTNIELVTQQTKLGGNGPIMANALAELGIQTTYLGALGYPNLHPVFQPLAQKTQTLTIADPAHTDALEFQDGKLMLGKTTPLNQINWTNLQQRLPPKTLQTHLNNAHLIAFLNWTMLPHMSDIWQRLLTKNHLPQRNPKPITFFDLCDPQKRETQHIQHALTLITQFQKHTQVILGLNEKEAHQIAQTLNIPNPKPNPQNHQHLAQQIRQKLQIHQTLIHPVPYAVAADTHNTYHAPGPLIKNPHLTTGAGDHFNAGYCLGQLLKLNPQHSLNLAVTASAHYVRTGHPPRITDLQNLLQNWPNNP